MLRLIKNEFIKEYTLKRIVITLLIFILISVATYVLFRVSKMASENYDAQYMYEQSVANYNDSLEKYDKSPTLSNLFFVEAFKEVIYILDFFYNNDNFEIDVNDWRYDALLVATNTFEIAAIKLISEGYDVGGFYPSSKYVNLTKEEAFTLYAELKEEQKQLFKLLENGTYKDYAIMMIPTIEDKIKKLEQTTSENDNIELSMTKTELKRYRFIVDHNIHSKKDFRYVELTYLESIEGGADTKLLSEEQYYMNGDLSSTYNDYDEYKEDQLGKIEYRNNEIEKVKYAVDYNIKYHGNDYKNISNYIILLSFVISAFVIARAGKVISDEHNSGSIRLLLTQGVSRTKIFLSKILSIYIDVLIHYFLFALIFLLIGLFIYPFIDLLYPNISVINDNIVLSSYFIDLIKNMLISMVPMSFIFSLSIFISIISWNTIASVGVPLFLILIGSPIISFLRSNHIGGIMSHLPFPYFDMTAFMPSFYGAYPNDFAFVLSTYNMGKGLIVLLIWTFVLLFTSLMIFHKRDISNE